MYTPQFITEPSYLNAVRRTNLQQHRSQWDNSEMVTKLPEIAVILGVIVLGLQLSRSANRSLGYSLVGLGAITGIWWIYNHYRKKVRVPRRVGKLRVELT